MYSLGGTIHGAPLCYSDKSIDWSKQRTKMVDSSITQDHIGIDWIAEKLGWDMGRSSAVKIAISNMIASWNDTYSGSLTILGDASINPCDWICLDDRQNKMNGVCGVKDVTQMMGADTGFITMITPELIATSTVQNAGTVNLVRSAVSFMAAVSANRFIRSMSISSVKNIGDVISSTKGAKTIMGITSKGKNIPEIWDITKAAIKNGKMTTWTEYFNSVKTAANAMKVTDEVWVLSKRAVVARDIIASIKGACVLGGSVVGPIGTIVGWLVFQVVFNIILGAIIEAFEYNYCITIHPLIYKGTPFAAGTKGSSHLMPGFSDTGVKYEQSAEADE